MILNTKSHLKALTDEKNIIKQHIQIVQNEIANGILPADEVEFYKEAINEFKSDIAHIDKQIAYIKQRGKRHVYRY